jgi:hypothetical protein
MMGPLKFMLTALGLVLIAIGIGAIVLMGQAERFVTKSTAEILSDTFESTARIDHISVSPTNRTLILHEFSLDNPKSFKEGQAVTAERIVLQVDPVSLLSKTPIIETMTLENTRIHYRLEVPDGTNIGTLAKRLEKRSQEKDARQFVVRKLICRDAQVEFSTHFVPDTFGVNLMTIELDDPQGEQAVSAAGLASIFLRSIIKETLTLKGLLSPVHRQLRRESDDTNADPVELEPL